MSALRFIKKQTVTSATASIQVTDIFSADFDVYFFNLTILDMATDKNLRMRFINSAGSVLTSDYNLARQMFRSSSSQGESRQTNRSYIELGYYDTDEFKTGMGTATYVYNPFISGQNTYVQSQSAFVEQVSSSAGYGNKTIGNIENSSQITGLEFHQTSGNFDNFEIICYGLRVDE